MLCNASNPGQKWLNILSALPEIALLTTRDHVSYDVALRVDSPVDAVVGECTVVPGVCHCRTRWPPAVEALLSKQSTHLLSRESKHQALVPGIAAVRTDDAIDKRGVQRESPCLPPHLSAYDVHAATVRACTAVEIASEHDGFLTTVTLTLPLPAAIFLIVTVFPQDNELAKALPGHVGLLGNETATTLLVARGELKGRNKHRGATVACAEPAARKTLRLPRCLRRGGMRAFSRGLNAPC